MLGNVSLGVSGCLGALLGGFLGDRFGIKTVAIIPRILLIIALFPVMNFLIASPSATTLVISISILSVLQGASSSVGVMLIPLIFPNTVRSTGLAITYALGVAIFGGSATTIVIWLVGVTGDPLASSYYVLAASVVMLIAIVSVKVRPS
jgi:MFS family permease